MLNKNMITRFWQKVQKTDGCWLWQGHLQTNGYAQITIKKKRFYVHRLAYQWTKGRISEELELDHLCRNPACVNPKHLEMVTHQENIRRGLVGQYQRDKTHCPKGHPYNEENTYRHNGARSCKACGKLRQIDPEYSRVASRASYRRRRASILAQKREYYYQKKEE